MDAFRLSSTRSRVALYVVIIATVMIGVTHYNVQDWSWPRKRMEAWFQYVIWDAQAAPGAAPAFTARPAIKEEFIGGKAQLVHLAREEYWKQFIARNAFTSSPIPGVSIDSNDLGILGGGALTLLMLVLLVCLMREHENLYLALYKVRQFARLPGHDHGTSEANLLYHALVMSQVLAAPPTLARWRKHPFLRPFGLLYLLPLAVYLWVIDTNTDSLRIAVAYVGADDAARYMRIHWVIAAILTILSVLVVLNSRAMAQRWGTAFKAVNPERHRMPQMSFAEWLRVPGLGLLRSLRKVRGADGICQARTATEIVDTFRAQPQPEQDFTVTNVVAVLEKVGRKIKPRQLRDMTKKVCEAGIAAAEERFVDERRPGLELLGFTTDTNHVGGDGVWRIEGSWRVRIKPKNESKKAPFWMRWRRAPR